MDPVDDDHVPSLPLVLKPPPTKRRALPSYESGLTHNNNDPASSSSTTYTSDRSVQPLETASSATAARLEDDAPAPTKSKFGKSHGPMRASSNVRTTTRFDYDPSICKDYKETGTCGYGDSCIYLHDRSDYKSGWQIEKEYNDSRSLLAVRTGGKGENKNKSSEEVSGSDSGTSQSSSDGSSSGLPFACFICRSAFTRPVVTRCGHYFCESCALTRFAKQKKRGCAVCGASLDGNFSVAKDLMTHLEKNKVLNK